MIVFEHVDKVYPNGFKALSDINLTVNDGDFISIIGLSGAGKSTLLRTINKMHDIQAGNLTVDVLNTVKKSKNSLTKELKRAKKSLESASVVEKEELSKEISLIEDIFNKNEFNDDETISFKETFSLLTVKGRNLRYLRRNIGMIFQSFNLVKRSNVYKNVLSGRVGYHNFFESCLAYTPKKKRC